jgi:SAM-dependent methyltransferase
MEYEGSEFAALAVAVNYYGWILRSIRSYLGRVVLEHGAGIGTFSTLLAAEPIDRLVAVEPATNLLPVLRERLAPWADRAEIIAGTLADAASLLSDRGIDTVVSVNVLEHIDDDRGTLHAMWKILASGGYAIVFVPALPWLYGSLDRAFEHVRRYRRQELRDKLSAAGFHVVAAKFMNMPGIVSWFIAGRVLRRTTLNRSAVRIYDRYIVPVIAKAEALCPPPVGQNLLLIARKRP